MDVLFKLNGEKLLSQRECYLQFRNPIQEHKQPYIRKHAQKSTEQTITFSCT
jgi:hypothetical protein